MIFQGYNHPLIPPRKARSRKLIGKNFTFFGPHFTAAAGLPLRRSLESTTSSWIKLAVWIISPRVAIHRWFSCKKLNNCSEWKHSLLILLLVLLLIKTSRHRTDDHWSNQFSFGIEMILGQFVQFFFRTSQMLQRKSTNTDNYCTSDIEV